jgi:hypothetical protein
VPTARDEVVKVATPDEVLPVPISVVPSRNVTVSPFGMLPELARTVAVKVTAVPKAACELEDLRDVLVGSLESTVSLKGVA